MYKCCGNCKYWKNEGLQTCQGVDPTTSANEPACIDWAPKVIRDAN